MCTFYTSYITLNAHTSFKLLRSLYLHFSNVFKIHLRTTVLQRFQFNMFDHASHLIECKSDICFYD